MPAIRKESSSGEVFWLAIHDKIGLILFDKNNQDGLDSDFCRVFCVDDLRYETISRQVLHESTTAEITEGDALRGVYRYRKFKTPQEPKVPLKTKILHRDYLKSMFVPAAGIKLADKNTLNHRMTVCWDCKARLDNQIDCECDTCNWIICSACGACGCGR